MTCVNKKWINANGAFYFIFFFKCFYVKIIVRKDGSLMEFLLRVYKPHNKMCNVCILIFINISFMPKMNFCENIFEHIWFEPVKLNHDIRLAHSTFNVFVFFFFLICHWIASNLFKKNNHFKRMKPVTKMMEHFTRTHRNGNKNNSVNKKHKWTGDEKIEISFFFYFNSYTHYVL